MAAAAAAAVAWEVVPTADVTTSTLAFRFLQSTNDSFPAETFHFLNLNLPTPACKQPLFIIS